MRDNQVTQVLLAIGFRTHNNDRSKCRLRHSDCMS